MHNIGNIVSPTKIEPVYRMNIVDSLDKCIPDIPTLVVGFDLISEIYPHRTPRVDNRKMDDYVYWTFNKHESRREFEIDIENFINACYKQLMGAVKYFFVDNIQLSEYNLWRTYEKIKHADVLVGYFHNDRMIYLYNDGIIFGMDLEICKFVDLDPEKVVNRLNISTGGLFDSKSIPGFYAEDVERLGTNIKYIPYLCFLDELYHPPST